MGKGQQRAWKIFMTSLELPWFCVRRKIRHVEAASGRDVDRFPVWLEVCGSGLRTLTRRDVEGTSGRDALAWKPTSCLLLPRIPPRPRHPQPFAFGLLHLQSGPQSSGSSSERRLSGRREWGGFRRGCTNGQSKQEGGAHSGWTSRRCSRGSQILLSLCST